MEAYSPLGHTGAPVLKMKAVLDVASAVNRTAAAVALKYIVQKNHSFVTASETSLYDKEDLDLFGWQLTEAQVAELDAATPHEVDANLSEMGSASDIRKNVR